MRRKNVISRFTTLVFATLACLLIAVLAPMFLSRHAADEPFSGYAVMASPRDMLVISAPVRLSEAPDLTLDRGTLYAAAMVKAQATDDRRAGASLSRKECQA